jgi:beta-lactamase superfamily II metal-dependent hydrolase
MELKIFDVEHGACALLSTDDGKQMMIDCGHHAPNEWYPGTYLRQLGIGNLDMLAITNYDEDHVSGLPNLRENVTVGRLWRNKTVTPEILKDLKSEDGMGSGIEELVDMATEYTADAAPWEMQGVERQAFHLNYPEFDDENNLSFVVHLRLNGIGFLFPGDLETKGWDALLARNEKFRAAVADTRVLIASHHGRLSGVCPDLFVKYGCKPYWIVISDKGYQHDTQETVPFYSLRAQGANFRGQERKVLTTRNDGRIRFWFGDGKWGAD